MMWPFRKKKDREYPCPKSIRNFLNFFSQPPIEDQLAEARKKKRPRLKLECVRNNKCPDCKVKGKILAGPRGGMCMNVRCGSCGSTFNITPFGVERI